MIASNRTRRATLRARQTANRAAARIRRTGVGTLATHCLAAGLTPREAQSVAGSLRKNATKAGVTGTIGRTFRKGAARVCTRYTRAAVALIAAIYRPRKAAYRLAAAKLALAA
ncbi:hypothetical protein [Streptomyces sp. SID14515]|uniref:hypothetical protein n=1 Tax=Streptomyces sp. SID14515 TaxID=2706074 RepID=UPI0013CC2DC6|nr:hypothetical protein [Streptomyces sp. SID14515]NEB42282.1 hypothetical protein [Streptomyces sp. SID14515]